MRIEQPSSEIPNLDGPTDGTSESASDQATGLASVNLNDQLEPATAGIFGNLTDAEGTPQELNFASEVMQADSAPSDSSEVVKLPSDASFQLQDHTLTMTSPVDKDSPSWAKAAAEGKTIPSMEFQIPKHDQNGQVNGYQTVKLT